jgi:hypothetical protein
MPFGQGKTGMGKWISRIVPGQPDAAGRAKGTAALDWLRQFASSYAKKRQAAFPSRRDMTIEVDKTPRRTGRSRLPKTRFTAISQMMCMSISAWCVLSLLYVSVGLRSNYYCMFP